MTRVKKGGITGNYCTFDPIKCQLGHFEFALAVKALVGNLLEAIDFIIGCHRDSQSEKRANYQSWFYRWYTGAQVIKISRFPP